MQEVQLVVENTRTRIYTDSPSALDLIDRLTSFQQNDALGTSDFGEPIRYNLVDQDNAWDGWVRFLDKDEDPPSFPSGLRFLVQHGLEIGGFAVHVQDLRKRPLLYPNTIPPIPLWPHQEACKDAMLSEGDVVAEMPPRGGKTRTLIEVVRESNLPTIWIAPTNAVVNQTVKEAEKWLGKHNVARVSANNALEHTECLLTIGTAAGCLKLPPDFFKSRSQLVCDECHHFTEGGAWTRHLHKHASHIFHRKGMSGTFFRSNGDDLALLAFIGRVGYSISSQDLLDKGFLVPTYTVFVPIEGKKIKPSAPDWFSPSGLGTLGLATYPPRLDAIASCAKHLESIGRTVLIIVGTKHQGYAVKERLDKLFPPKSQDKDFAPVEFVSTDRPKPIIQQVFKSFIEHQEVKILIGTSMVGEGVDLPPADALVFGQGGKAAVSYTQAIYRVCTASPGKQFGVIVDFVDKHHRTLLDHSRLRWQIASSDPVFRMSHLTSLDQFPGWASGCLVQTE